MRDCTYMVRCGQELFGTRQQLFETSQELFVFKCFLANKYLHFLRLRFLVCYSVLKPSFDSFC